MCLIVFISHVEQYLISERKCSLNKFFLHHHHRPLNRKKKFSDEMKQNEENSPDNFVLFFSSFSADEHGIIAQHCRNLNSLSHASVIEKRFVEFSSIVEF